jgi:hypothetical protein
MLVVFIDHEVKSDSTDLWDIKPLGRCGVNSTKVRPRAMPFESVPMKIGSHFCWTQARSRGAAQPA